MTDLFISPISEEEKEEKAKLEQKKKKKPKNEFSAWGIFFGILLFAVLLTMWELGFSDLPKFFSPYYDVCRNASPIIIQQQCNMKQFDIVNLLLHISLLIPLLLVAVSVSYANSGKKMQSHNKIVLVAYLFSVLILSIHLFIEFARYLFEYYREVGDYVILICIAIAFIGFIIYLQKRFNRPKEV